MATSFKPSDSRKGMIWRDEAGKEIGELGRGTTDTSVTFLKLYNTGATAVYVYPNSGGTGVTVTTTAP